jgi:branched-chain amino acid transport system substrate-binding protein
MRSTGVSVADTIAQCAISSAPVWRGKGMFVIGMWIAWRLPSIVDASGDANGELQPGPQTKGERRPMQVIRRQVLGGMAAGAASLMLPRVPLAQGREIKVALIAPLSGPWGRSGQLMKIGADMAIEDINAKGGVKIGGNSMKMRLVSADAGDSVERAKNAAQRFLAQEPDIVAGTGAWLSSFTIAVTEVTERAKLPWVTLSYADGITNRGFKYVIQTNSVSTEQAANAMPAVMDMAQRATGKRPSTVALITDSTTTAQTFTEPLRKGGFEKLGVKIVSDQIYTAPLSDATSLVQNLRTIRPRPDFVLFYSSNSPDASLVVQKLHEFGLPQTKLPLVCPGAVHLGAPEMLKSVNAKMLEGTLLVVANWGSKRQGDLLPALIKRSGEPWLNSDVLSTYGDMWLIKEAVERAGSTDRDKVMEALRATNTNTGPARYYLGGKLKFDAAGRRVGAPTAVVQWRNGQPVTVYPAEDALMAPLWPRS